ncbi:neuronal acetylcholine receptor subunit alpha-10-like [Frankliniella occidentalis]|uniref:Neuronal acetylcholine receptor subunit alpha-10-like n=1 Tax=Frankliniella occidentalis TaxID=133901 RepID=A0A9C6X0M6_FRAOC|nr:neuronal acetylcholine receptor subunit alpha-10-like [Frankliniella occidentalis]
MRMLLLAVVATAAFLRPGLADDNEYRLTRFLMDKYDASVRPVENASMPLQVTFGVSLHHIIDVDEKNQILTTNCWLTQIWLDHHLRWNQSEFNGINVVRIPFNRVWKPDLILYNNADSQYSTAAINTNVIVYSNGMVTWLSHGIYRSSCDIDVEFFPFDIQACNMKWASWTYDGYQLDLLKQTEDGDVSNYQANGEFDLVSFDAKKHVEYYSCCPEPYPDITYVIRIRRRPLFYVFNLILPCILINCIALLVFYVPSESGEKVTLGISALLSMTVFLMTIRESLPPTEKTPLISLYYGVSICLVSFASGLSVVTLNVYHRGVRGTGVPPIIKTCVLHHLARLVFLRFEPRDKAKPQHHNDVTRLGPRPDKWIPEDATNVDPQQMSPRFSIRHRTNRTPDGAANNPAWAGHNSNSGALAGAFSEGECLFDVAIGEGECSVGASLTYVSIIIEGGGREEGDRGPYDSAKGAAECVIRWPGGVGGALHSLLVR